jgi:hypothetical protein
MRKLLRVTALSVSGLTLLILGSTAVSWAAPIPEIDPSSGMSALALLAGALLVIRARRDTLKF